MRPTPKRKRLDQPEAIDHLAWMGLIECDHSQWPLEPFIAAEQGGRGMTKVPGDRAPGGGLAAPGKAPSPESAG